MGGWILMWMWVGVSAKSIIWVNIVSGGGICTRVLDMFINIVSGENDQLVCISLKLVCIMGLVS